MEEKIEEVQDYFVNKILAGDFEIEKWTEYVCYIKIDGKYKFNIWVCNEPKETKPCIVHTGYFMDICFTSEQAFCLDSILYPMFKNWKQNVLLKEKKEQYEKLKIELNIN